MVLVYSWVFVSHSLVTSVMLNLDISTTSDMQLTTCLMLEAVANKTVTIIFRELSRLSCFPDKWVLYFRNL